MPILRYKEKKMAKVCKGEARKAMNTSRRLHRVKPKASGLSRGTSRCLLLALLGHSRFHPPPCNHYPLPHLHSNNHQCHNSHKSHNSHNSTRNITRLAPKKKKWSHPQRMHTTQNRLEEYCASSLECGVGSAMRELKVRSVKCSVKSVGCGVYCVECGSWSIGCGG